MGLYEPRPIKVSTIGAPLELEALIERLAENAHDVWARKRLDEGWVYGKERDPDKKTTPFLVPYNELPEEEKNTDRLMVRGVLGATRALGWSLRTPHLTQPSDPKAIASLAQWEADLTNRFDDVPTTKNAWTFDMDDAPELASAHMADLPQAKAALQHLQDVVHSAWQKADQEALKFQDRHRTMAKLAIWPGTAAIALAILQLAFLQPSFQKDFHGIEKILGWMEIIAVVIAFLAVIWGHFKGFHHHWLAFRQHAERLRNLKFSALCWPELWCDLDRWKERVNEQVAEISKHEEKKEAVWPKLPSIECEVPEADLRALAAFYRVKRLLVQQRYFKDRSESTARRSWVVNWKVSLLVFYLSVLVVLGHAIHESTGHHSPGEPPDKVATALITLAALLPVLGFGLRAWVAAFEAPRSRNLYVAKAYALESYIEGNRDAAADPTLVAAQITQAEHFFEGEHGEWSRLQREAEWFL